MEEWKTHLQRGVASFRADKWDEALLRFTKAIQLKPDAVNAYDSRAATYQKLGRLTEALQDCKTAIGLAPLRWQSYARSSRLFLQLKRYESALKMSDLALERVAPEDDRKIAELTTLREEITAARTHADIKLKEYKSRTVYHFGKLPVELATEIFRLAVENDHASVVLLAAVCRPWRNTIIGTPSLWTTLVLSNRNVLRKARTWKERSRKRLVEVFLRAGQYGDHSLLKELQDIVWTSLRRLRLHDISPGEGPLLLSAFPTTILQHLDLLEIHAPKSLAPLKWFDEASRSQLRTLMLTNVSVDWLRVSNVCHDLESLTIHDPRGTHWMPHVRWLLHSNPKLASLTLDLGDDLNSSGHTIDSSDLPPERRLPDILPLPSLLELRVVHRLASAALLRSLSMPSLQRLSFDMTYGTIDPCLSHILSTGTATSLKELTIRNCSLSAGLMIGLLRSATVLESLELSSLGGNQANLILEALAYSAAVHPAFIAANPESNQESQNPPKYMMLCPSLRRLDLSHCPDVKSGPLVRFVKNRLINTESFVDGCPSQQPVKVSPITTLIVDGCPAIDPEVLPWIRSKVPNVSCIYLTKKKATWKR